MLLYSRQLAGPYKFHRQTVISADSRFARGAGRLFEQDGLLIRPAQDLTGPEQEGNAIHFRRIVELSPERYREEDFADFRPPKHWRGIRSYDRFGPLEAIDARAPKQ